jgi:hypothetical protein
MLAVMATARSNLGQTVQVEAKRLIVASRHNRGAAGDDGRKEADLSRRG